MTADATLKIATVRQLAGAIRSAAKRGDNEKAHRLEADLRRSVLKSIAAGQENARELAALAMETEQIAFSRWFA